MEHVRLGRAGLRVSRLCLGTMNFGPLTSERDSFAIMERALEVGINFFDTPTCTAGARARASPSRSSAPQPPAAASARLLDSRGGTVRLRT